jgi:2-polyprenyl-3-methyl-5-hydroxy-6-metoxy-1,4-benzoquinol methylase
MPYSYSKFKQEIKDHIHSTLIGESLTNFGLTKNLILDVGAGSGTYGLLLNHYYPSNIHAIEIHEPNVHQFKLLDIYARVYVCNVLDFQFLDNYNYYIFGDVIEHMTVADAQSIIKRITNNKKKCLVAVPYMYEQGEYEGNIYEIHLQPDLTKEIFLERYPEMNFLMGDDSYGYFINY